MTKKIKLTIQEIVCDFERMIRHHERLDVHFDFEKADENEIDEFHDEMLGLMEKYLPGYEKHVPKDYLKDETPTFDKALILYGELYRNFKEMFYQLVQA